MLGELGEAGLADGEDRDLGACEDAAGQDEREQDEQVL